MPVQSPNHEKSPSRSPRCTSPLQTVYDEDLAPPQLPQFAVSDEIRLSLKSQQESRQLQRIGQQLQGINRVQSIRKGQQLCRQSQVQLSQNTTGRPSVPQITVETDPAITIADGEEEWSVLLSKPASFERSEKDNPSIPELALDLHIDDHENTAAKRRRWAIAYEPPLFPVENVLQPPMSETKIARSPSSTRPIAKEADSSFSVSATLKSHTSAEDERREMRICHDVGSLISEDDPPIYDVTRPTCSLMLVCYRSGPKACESKQIEVVSRSRFDDVNSFKQLVNLKPELLRTDRQFFLTLRKVYQKDMCSIRRRLFSLKTLRSIRLLSVSQCFFCRKSRSSHYSENTLMLTANHSIPVVHDQKLCP
jgi:hypothetical protein